jgi:TonB family protein
MGMAMKSACLVLLAVAALYFSSGPADAQSSALTLTRLDEAHLDSLAALTAKKIREAQLTEKEPSVLVVDFFRNSPGTTTQLGTMLADRFSELLSGYGTGMKVLDRRTLKNYLTENWTTLEDLHSYDVCFRVARQLGATGAVLGALVETEGRIDLTLHLEGFGPKEKGDDLFAWRDRTVSFSPTEDLNTTLFQPGPNYARSAEEIPEEPGTFRFGANGVTPPQCIYCPDPGYSDAARAAEFQGKAQLSVLVTPEGLVTSIYVLKGAPFGLTAQAIKAAKNWRFAPGRKGGTAVPVRVVVEIAFSLLETLNN